MAGRTRSPGRGRSGWGSSEQEFAVIGLGSFGASLARRLEAMGHQVLGVDIDTARVQEISDEITSAVALDATIEDALAEVDVSAFGTVIIAIGGQFEATALIASCLKRLGIPRVICMAKTRRHRDILLSIGASDVIVSDEDSGIRLAEVLAAPNLMERATLDSTHSLTEFKIPASLVGHPVTRLSDHGVTAILIYRPPRLIPCPGAEVRFEAGDTVFAVGKRTSLLQVASLP